MPYTENIKQIKKGFSCGGVLLETYCKLMVVELLLEAVDPKGTHDIPAKLNHLARQNPGKASVLNHLSVSIRGKYSAVKVNGRVRGGGVGVMDMPSRSYPFIRYARFSEDFDTDACGLNEIRIIGIEADKIINEIKSLGYR